MELDKNTIKALAADTRIDILKSLQKRRKMPTELAKELGLATSTVTEHLQHLESVGLIEKKHTGHKWIYYQLTNKGSNIVKPQYPVNIILTLGIGIIFLAGGLFYHISNQSFVSSGSPAWEKASNAQLPQSFDEQRTQIKQVSTPTTIGEIKRVEVDRSVFSLILLVIGSVLIVLSVVFLYRRLVE